MDDHKGLEVAAAKVLGATVQRCRVPLQKGKPMSFAELIWLGMLAGIGVTAFTDVIAVGRQGWAMTHGFYCLVGRWVGSLPQNGVFHSGIRRSTPAPFEAVLGWAAHILLGVIYWVCFMLSFGPSALYMPQLWQGVGFGIVTVLVPWLVFQPLFGWGVGMSKAPDPWKMRLKGIITHTVFGLGIWGSMQILKAVLSP